jgi:hypothetical protein
MFSSLTGTESLNAPPRTMVQRGYKPSKKVLPADQASFCADLVHQYARTVL